MDSQDNNASNTDKQLQIHFNLVGGLSMDIISGSPREELAYFEVSVQYRCTCNWTLVISNHLTEPSFNLFLNA